MQIEFPRVLSADHCAALVNHFPDDPRRTVEENIANYEQKQRAAAAGGS